MVAKYVTFESNVMLLHQVPIFSGIQQWVSVHLGNKERIELRWSVCQKYWLGSLPGSTLSQLFSCGGGL